MTERKLRKTLLKSIPLITDRLILRYIEPKDAYDMYDYASRPEVCEFLLWSPHVNVEATEGYIEYLSERYRKGLYADWAVVLKSNDKMIGTCGYSGFDASENSCEIGYVLSPDYQGNGYMSEAVKAVIDLSFETLSLSEITLRIIEENKKSRKLAERLGFKLNYISDKELEIKGQYRNIAHYSMTNNEYEKKKR